MVIQSLILINTNFLLLPVIITPEFIIETIRTPDQIQIKEDHKRIVQKKLNENLVIRVVYREFKAFILIITLYPVRRNRYEKLALIEHFFIFDCISDS